MFYTRKFHILSLLVGTTRGSKKFTIDLIRPTSSRIFRASPRKCSHSCSSGFEMAASGLAELQSKKTTRQSTVKRFLIWFCRDGFERCMQCEFFKFCCYRCGLDRSFNAAFYGMLILLYAALHRILVLKFYMPLVLPL